MPLDGSESHANASNPVSGTSGPALSVRRFAWSEGLSRGILASLSKRLTGCVPRGSHTRLEKGDTQLTLAGS